MKEESIESQSTDTTSTSDDSDNAQGTPKLELEGSPSMISTPNSLETETPVEEPETCPGNEEGDWECVKDYLEQHSDALTTQISLTGDTALHIAVLGGHVKIVEELVHMISAKDLALPNRTGETALSLAAAGGITEVAKPLVRKNHDLLGMKNHYNGNIPVVVAAQFGHVNMVHNLYWVTQEKDLDPETTNQGAKLLTTCIIAQIYDVALDLVQRFPALATTAPCIKHIHETKVKHVQVHELLGCISKDISALNHSELYGTKLFPAVFEAVKHRNSEFVEEIITAYPDIVWILDEESRNIFLFAVLQREEKVFCLLHEMGPRKNLIATSLDKNGNTILHHAAMLSPSSHLDQISSAALQMQRELQWFEEVEKVVQPMYRELPNNEGMTARALFNSQHHKMRKQGEKWMKETATSCTVVAALIATIMFTSAFTVPCGYDNKTGDPLYLNHGFFMIFIVADALSLLSSASSVLMFLGILKSRYNIGEFLFSLPCKLVLGIATLFFSIVTMMLTFATTIHIVLHDRLSWIGIPIVLFSGIPVMIFMFPQVPLLYEICASTFWSGIFERPNKRYR
ncbi:hypothetical protein RHMOL_Rhmol08G0004200 [Rhododendron molle]|uniref:Uncharacterized protein n=1 Tax=Rhododendron molle TaxID=49168 RepID=A0ACC0MJB1_RHOML|nr:hypothetical protein RHMOL_Rhmol08G0004200 [Rhododendron molle]